MKKLLICLVASCLVFSGSLAMAWRLWLYGNSATQRVYFSVFDLREISVSGNPPPLVVSSATAGSSPDEVSDSSTTYNITCTTQGSEMRISAALEEDYMPAGTTLKIRLAAPPGAVSTGDVPLVWQQDYVLVEGIRNVAAAGLPITYKFSATSWAGQISGTRTVLLTIIGPPI